MNLRFGPDSARELAERTFHLIGSGRELSLFGEQDPALAGECGVEICSLEARTILSAGAPYRVLSRAEEGMKSGRPIVIPMADLDQVSRLEAIVSMGSSRISHKLAAIDAEIAQRPAANLGSVVSLASGAIGLIKTFL